MAVAEHLGGVEVTAYLGHIFSTGLNFQTSMWQLVITEAVYLPNMMREHLRLETETLQLFVEVVPILTACKIPPPPFPTITQSSSASRDAGGTAIKGPLLLSLQIDSGVATSMGPMALATTPALLPSGGTQPGTLLSGRQRLQSRMGLKLLTCATTHHCWCAGWSE